MRPTGNTDEYVAYIKGYKKSSKVDYYVFAADESGRNRQQHVFGKSDPHSFNVAGEENIFENNFVNVDVSPNPMNDVLCINTGENVDITIYNSVGQQLIFVENEKRIDVSSLTDGLYFVKIADDKGNVFVKKVVK